MFQLKNLYRATTAICRCRQRRIFGVTTVAVPHRRDVSSLVLCLPTSSSLPTLSSLSTALLFDPTTSTSVNNHQWQRHQQVRWKRKDGNKWHGKERTPTKKQRKKFHRHLQTIQAEKEDKHGKPGSKAGPRREWNQAAREDLLNNNDDEDDDGETLRLQSSSSNDDEYGMGDALLDDLIGNTVQAAADPQPAPYTGHKHRKYFNAVADHMDDYRKYQQQQQQLLLQQQQTLDHDHQTTTKSEQLELSSLMVPVDLPSDDMIAKAVRAFRDKNGTRQRPVGLIAALSHVIQDMGVPLSALNEYSYNALLTCCRSPAEARRIFQMMREQQHHGMSTAPITAYSWTILADIYAKAGDFEGCKTVQQEMLQAGVPPTLASYTSLLAACYKVCIDGGRVPHRVRAQAAAVGWQTWQEMRIVGIEPDVMAYGAVLRLQAALGQPEACLNLLEEMPRFHVAPTALCFASALRAVARSHATAIRYEKGASRRNRRREAIAAHHGKLARRVLIQAESAGVAVHDDPGLVAALCLCAAAAGDAATAKAIYVASQICQQQQDSLRTIGSNRHLARLRGERATWPDDDASTLDLLPRKQQEQEQQRQAHRLGGSASSVDLGSDYYDEGGELLESDRASDRGHIAVSRRDDQRRYPSYGEREYGKDTRVLSAILHACAQAVDMNGIGTIWQGRENKGYLCANSLRLIAAPKIPQYYDNSIPGQKITDNLTWSGEHTEGYREGKRKSRKFEGVDVDEEAGSTLDELDEMFSGIYLDEDGKLKAEYRKTTPSEIWLKKYGDDWDADDNREDQRQHIVARSSPTQDHGAQPEAEFQAKSLPAKAEEPKDGMYFDYDTMRWKTRPKLPESKVAENARFKKDANVVPSTAEPVDRSSNNEIVEEMFFDNDTMRWKTRTKVNLVTPDQENVSMFANESDEESGSDSESDSEEEEDETENELYFDDNEKRWKTRFQEDVEAGAAVSLTKYESEALLRSSDSVEEYEDESIPEGVSVPKSDEESFALFFSDLRKEVAESGQDEVSEEEARELFLLMKDEYNEMITLSPEELGLENHAGLGGVDLEQRSSFDVEMKDATTLSSCSGNDKSAARSSPSIRDDDFFDVPSQEKINNKSKSKDFGAIVEELKDGWRDQGFDLGEDDTTIESLGRSAASDPTRMLVIPRTVPLQQTRVVVEETTRQQTVVTYDETWDEPTFENLEEEALAFASSQTSFMEGAHADSVEIVDPDEEEEGDVKLEELRQLFPAFSDTRLRKILRVFQNSLGDPPLLELIPIVRENMPDYITATWLKQMSALTAKFVVQKAAQDDLINAELLNGVLELQASSGSLDRAIDFHQTEFSMHKLEPTAYSDRLVLQMLLKNNRLSRALAFKQKVESSGRSLDIKAYGSLVEYCSRRQQLGSSMLLLKECLSVHGAPPGEATLSKLRLLCRQAGLVEEVDLDSMIGPDPVEWLRHGEAELKREMSKRGRRDTQMARNQLVRL